MDIKQGIVGILNTEGEIIGTGFLASKNTVLTCSHVIKQGGSDKGKAIRIRFAIDNSEVTARVDPEIWSPVEEYDVALLHVESKPLEAKPLRFGKSTNTSGNEFRTYGYGKVGGVQGLGGRGVIIDRVERGNLLQITSQEIDRGFSGAPILDETRQVVVGMVSWGKLSTITQRHRDTTLAVTTEAISDVHRDLKLIKFSPLPYLLTLKKQWPVVVAIVVFVSVALALYFGLRPKQKRFMTGIFNIAIASFDEHGKELQDDIGFTIADGINQRFARDLQEITGGPKLEIWGPARVGIIRGETAPDRAENAKNLADKIQANMVIYGVVEETQTGMNVIPEFYVSNIGFFEGSEVIGQYQLGSVLSLPRNYVNDTYEKTKFNDEMTNRSHIIFKLATGLSYYAHHDYEKALEIFQKVDQEIEWPKNEMDREQGKEVLYALIGFSAAKVGQYEIAERALEKAIELNPDYSRPYIGMANLNYMLALQPSNGAGVDQDLLDKCFHYLELAVQAREKPPFAEVDTKIHFARGQCYWLKAYSGQLPDYELAIDEFQWVIENYDGKNLSIMELAAESHARLGLIYKETKNLTEAVHEYELAVHEYEPVVLLSDEIRARQELYQKRADEIQELIQQSTP